MSESIDLGRWSEEDVESMLRDASRLPDPGPRIAFLSGCFLGTPYHEATLLGSSTAAETLTVNFSGVDCFTLLDYVEALRRSADFEEFLVYLRRVRYRSGNVSFRDRNHFFTDWIIRNNDAVSDVTAVVGGAATAQAVKVLNRKDDGSLFVEGIEPEERTISFIPSPAITPDVAANLRTGDYLGVYSALPGLDVSHVGICIHEGEPPVFRHASSHAGQVIDQDLQEYFSKKPGMIVLRPCR